MNMLGREQEYKILYVGSMNSNSNSFRRFKTIKEMGYHIEAVDIDKYIYKSIFSSVHHRANIGPGIWGLNKKVRSEILKLQPQLIWVDNKPFINGKTIRTSRKIFPELKWINVVTDDPTGRYRKAWRIFKATAPLYDKHFVQRIENVSEIKAYGAKRVELCFRSYDPKFHRKVELSVEDRIKYKTAVGFIGTYEREREEAVAYLIKNGIRVSVTGDGWPGGVYWSLIQPYYTGPSVYGEEYIKRLNGMGIALHFLRHANRDGQDSRTFEIPACKVFMIAERSDLHLKFFKEDSEAVFFSTKEELLMKVMFYLSDAELRNQIAIEGYNRCVSCGYNHESRIKFIIDNVINE